MNSCERVSNTGSHVPADEMVEDERCLSPDPHEDHYWSVQDHEHIDVEWKCMRYCEGIRHE